MLDAGRRVSSRKCLRREGCRQSGKEITGSLTTEYLWNLACHLAAKQAPDIQSVFLVHQGASCRLQETSAELSLHSQR